jgi:hypothetical protein
MEQRDVSLTNDMTPEEAIKMMADFITNLNHRCEILTDSLERIASGMLTQGESQAMAEIALDEDIDISWS